MLSPRAAGDHDKVQRLDRRVTELAGFSSCYTICGQTYPRKVDVQIVQALASLGASAHKVGTRGDTERISAQVQWSCRRRFGRPSVFRRV